MIARFARPYAEALLHTAKSTENAAAVRDELRRFVDLMKAQPAIGRLAANPGVPREKKQLVVDEAAKSVGLGPLATSFVRLLLSNFRLGRLPEVVEALDDRINRRLGIAVAEVVTAEPLAPPMQQRLEAALRERLGQQVQLKSSVDPKLLAGFVARIDSVRYDASLRGQIDRLAERLAQVDT